MGGGKSFKQPSVATPRPPQPVKSVEPVAARNEVSTVEPSSAPVTNNAADESKSQALQNAGGRTSTIITGALGDTSIAPVAGKTLLGQ